MRSLFLTTRRRLAATSLVVALAGSLVGCNDLEVISNSAPGTSDEIPIRVSGMTLNTYQGARLDHVIRAEEASLFQRGRDTELTGLSMDFYPPEGDEPASTLEAERGVINFETDTFVALAQTEHIRITRADEGILLYTRDFIYDPSAGPGGEGELYTENPFIMLKANPDGTYQEVRGNGMRSDRQLSYVAIERGNRTLGRPHVDVEEFERINRPLSQEATP
jgi:hypothetical protein